MLLILKQRILHFTFEFDMRFKRISIHCLLINIYNKRILALFIGANVPATNSWWVLFVSNASLFVVDIKLSLQQNITQSFQLRSREWKSTRFVMFCSHLRHADTSKLPFNSAPKKKWAALAGEIVPNEIWNFEVAMPRVSEKFLWELLKERRKKKRKRIYSKK